MNRTPHQVVVETKGESGELGEGPTGGQGWDSEAGPRSAKGGRGTAEPEGGKELCQQRSLPQRPGSCGPPMLEGA